MFPRHKAALLVALLASLAAPTSQANFFSSLFSGGDDSARITQWAANPAQPLKWGEWDQVRLERHAGTPNDHPAQVSTEQVAAALASIQIQAFRQIRPLFAEAEVRRFSLAISLALAKAGPDQDVVFISTGEHETGLISPTLANSGRIFFADGRINVLLGMAHYDFLVDLRRGSQRPPAFLSGDRSSASADVKVIGLTKGDAKLVRSDWIAITPPKIEPKPAPKVYTFPLAGKPAEAPKIYTFPLASPAPQAVPATAPTAAPADNEAFYGKQEARLRTLQKMHQQGLINDEELKAKRTAILGDI
ncbi:SHOCT domain-containing protein [Niveibacterium terrae]|uniref:SHOCT domain-containing protein n=1 Tax=Niveibacterium terrae TaxID=3373598 RepID=UPI003A9140CF